MEDEKDNLIRERGREIGGISKEKKVCLMKREGEKGNSIRKREKKNRARMRII